MPIAKGLASASRSRGAHHHMMIDQLEALIATLPALLA